MTKSELAKEIYKVSHLTGSFVLRSGKTSTEYFDKYLFESYPHLMDAISDEMVKLIPENTDVLAGLEMGGIPLASVLSLKSGIPMLSVRKEAKTYGTCKFAEGLDYNGKNVCIVEDVVTTGGQIIKSANDLRKTGAIVKYVISVIQRENTAYENLKKSDLEHIPLFKKEELEG